jgi:hypothetical protein
VSCPTAGSGTCTAVGDSGLPGPVTIPQTLILHDTPIS